MLKDLPLEEGKNELTKVSNQIKAEAETLIKRIEIFQKKIAKCKTKEDVEKVIEYDDMEKGLNYINLSP